MGSPRDEPSSWCSVMNDEYTGRPLLGAILEDKFGLTEAKLLEAMNVQGTKGGRSAKSWSGLRSITEDQLLQALAIQFDLPWLPNLDVSQVDHEWVKKVPIHFARRYHVLPLRTENGSVLVATIDPTETAALDDLRLLLGLPIKPVLTSSLSLLACLNRVYDEAASPAGAEQVMEDIAASESLDQIAHELDEPQDLLDATDEAPIIRLVNSVLFQAVRQRASDIHFESFERGLVVRYRIDGVLYPVLTPPKHLQASIIARLKIMAGLNIAEKRLPQDGRFRIRTAGKDVDLRVSVLPTSHGERVVLRLLEKENRLLNLSEMGFPPSCARPEAGATVDAARGRTLSPRGQGHRDFPTFSRRLPAGVENHLRLQRNLAPVRVDPPGSDERREVAEQVHLLGRGVAVAVLGDVD